MSLTRQSVGALIDLIENKLSCMTVHDRDDLRERVSLQRALYELSSLSGMNQNQEAGNGEIPRRGRRRRIASESFV